MKSIPRLSLFCLLLLSSGAFAQTPVESWSPPASMDRRTTHVFSHVYRQSDDMAYMPRNYSKRISRDGYEYRFECRAVSKTWPVHDGKARLNLTVPLGGRNVEVDVDRSKIAKPVSVSTAPTLRSASINPQTVPESLKPRRVTFRRML